MKHMEPIWHRQVRTHVLQQLSLHVNDELVWNLIRSAKSSQQGVEKSQHPNAEAHFCGVLPKSNAMSFSGIPNSRND
jgi:hypothetical protein